MLATSSQSIKLSNGLKLEVLKSTAKKPTTKPPLLFVHGSYHGAWCWQERFQPYFAEAGYDSWAVSLRSQGGSERQQGVKVAGTLDSHAADLAEVVQQLGAAPVMVPHSFGGLIAQKYILDSAPANSSSSSSRPAAGSFPRLAGVAFLASVPPSGNRDLIIRWLKRDLVLSWKVTWAFVGKSFANSVDDAKYAFFSDDLPQEDAVSYQQQLAACSPIRLLDLKDMQQQVPLPAPPADCPPVFVLGGEDDRVLDVQSYKELADYYGTKAVVLPKMAHDVMLDTRWEAAADALRGWLDTTY
uniref:AB hydrolase-1 domain-containing protein n=1 Tax=Tetradesmus obliquus TaxID=3088 RepID=A0A383W958_TETOB|eukprot:jgi/Sobl393_1/19332/SZX76054.1